VTRAEWNRAVAMVLAIWPGSPWPKVTAEAGWSMLGDLPFEAVRRGIRGLADEGREFSPSLSVVAERSRYFARELAPRLPSGDELRDPTPEERARAERWRIEFRERLSRIGRPRQEAQSTQGERTS
jgi:hypothetical protein